jgi:hypothetical protein
MQPTKKMKVSIFQENIPPNISYMKGLIIPRSGIPT